MTLVMAEKDPPVFRDFLGIGRKEEESSTAAAKQPPSGLAKRNGGLDEENDVEISTRASSGNSGRFEAHPAPGLLTPPPFGIAFPTSAEPGSEVWQRARAGPLQHAGVKSAFYKPEADARPLKRRESPVGRESLQERLQMSVEALENSRPSKVARVEQKDEKRGKFRSGATTMDELRLSMQPPRPSSKGVLPPQTNPSKPDLSSRIPGKQDRSRAAMNIVLPGPPVRPNHLGVTAEKPPGQLTMESNLSGDNVGLPPIAAPPAADEGSRTGIKNSGLLANLQQSASPSTQLPGMSGLPSPTSRRPKVSSQSAGSDCMLSSRHQFSAPPSRQLTIFYGGQAHVFDDVSPEKANNIMQLAGSNGRSWSTTYSPRGQPASNSAGDGSLSALERDREKILNFNRSGSISGGNLALPSEVHSLLKGLAQSGGGRSGQSAPSSALPLSTSAEIQLAAVAANGVRKEGVERRSVARASSCTEDSGKEDWM